MTEDLKLTPRTNSWINAIKAQYSSELIEDKRAPLELKGSLTK